MNPIKLAVIQTGGKQYLVKPGQKLKIEKLDDAKEGDTISLDKVLLIINGEDINLGKPLVKDANVNAKVLKNGRSEKITVMKYKRKTRARKKIGHRQHFTEIEIENIK